MTKAQALELARQAIANLAANTELTGFLNPGKGSGSLISIKIPASEECPLVLTEPLYLNVSAEPKTRYAGKNTKGDPIYKPITCGEDKKTTMHWVGVSSTNGTLMQLVRNLPKQHRRPIGLRVTDDDES